MKYFIFSNESTINYTLFSFVIIFTTTLIFSYSIDYFFIFDDTAIFSKLASLSTIDIFSMPSSGFYRPAGLIFAKFQYLLFGWDYPAGYSITSIIIHSISTIVFYYLLRELNFNDTTIIISPLIFLASPWATEAIFWVSSQFDLFSVMFGLSSLLFLSFYIKNNRLLLLIVSINLYVIAIIFKENLVIIIPFILTIIFIKNRQLSISKLAIIIGPFIVVTVCYLVVRSVMLPGFGSPYGKFEVLYQNINFIGKMKLYLEALLFFDSKFYLSVYWLSYIYTIGATLCLLALMRRLGILILIVTLFSISIMPVIWASVSSESTAGGRLLYAPGLVWSVSIGIGAANLWNFRIKIKNYFLKKISCFSTMLLLVLLVFVAYMSTISQIRLWRFATGLSRNTINYIFSMPNINDSYFHIKNLPSGTIQGPYLLKTYNLIHHARGIGKELKVHISADTISISIFNPSIIISNGPDIFGEKRLNENIKEINLPIEILRPPLRSLFKVSD